jgi:hypothetical protein
MIPMRTNNINHSLIYPRHWQHTSALDDRGWIWTLLNDKCKLGRRTSVNINKSIDGDTLPTQLCRDIVERATWVFVVKFGFRILRIIPVGARRRQHAEEQLMCSLIIHLLLEVSSYGLSNTRLDLDLALSCLQSRSGVSSATTALGMLLCHATTSHLPIPVVSLDADDALELGSTFLSKQNWSLLFLVFLLLFSFPFSLLFLF